MMRSAGSMMARASSGSRSRSSSVEPLMSANSAVTVLRSPSETSATAVSSAARTGGADSGWIVDFVVAGVRGAAHSPQNRAAGEFSNPHREHRDLNGAAHCSQNLSPAGFSAPKFEQSMSDTQVIEQRLCVLQVGGVEAFGEPAVDVGEHSARLIAITLLAEQPCEADSRARFQRFPTLAARDFDGGVETALRLHRIPCALHQQQ